jgi:hypothetical protein
VLTPSNYLGGFASFVCTAYIIHPILTHAGSIGRKLNAIVVGPVKANALEKRPDGFKAMIGKRPL